MCSSTKRRTSRVVMERVGAGIGYRYPNRAATQPRFRGGANQTWTVLMGGPQARRGGRSGECSR